uniref:Uncharacterized protein n=1 Tax=Anguilla anguilla TaxID=7936 RepID=A0A0E9X8W4_ANGAN
MSCGMVYNMDVPPIVLPPSNKQTEREKESLII